MTLKIMLRPFFADVFTFENVDKEVLRGVRNFAGPQWPKGAKGKRKPSLLATVGREK